MARSDSDAALKRDYEKLAHHFADQLIELWNTADDVGPDIPLHEWMGLTWEQYAAWVECRYGEVLP